MHQGSSRTVGFITLAWGKNNILFFRSGSADQYNEKRRLLSDINMMRRDADEWQKALKAAAKAEKEANKKKSDLRLAAMRQSCTGKDVQFCKSLIHPFNCLSIFNDNR